MKKPEEYLSIQNFGSISALGGCRNDVIDSYKRNDSFLTEKSFNNRSYVVGRINNTAEEQIEELLLRFPKFRKTDRSVQMALKASEDAIQNLGWDSNIKVTGVNIGSSRGATTLFEKYHKEFLFSKDATTDLRTSPLTTLGNISSHIASFISSSGPCIENSTTCTTTIQALANASAWISAGMADRFVAGASEAPLSDFTMAQVEALGIYTNKNKEGFPCRPFSSEKELLNTFALGEASVVFAVEKMNRDEIVDNPPICIVESFGYSYKPPPSLTGIDKEGQIIQNAMNMAIDTMCTVDQIDLVLLHGTGTVKGDQAELKAVREVFGDIPIALYANKWKCGHTYAASAGLSIELAILLINGDVSISSLPYPNNLTEIPNKINKVLINSNGFGGNAASVIVSSPRLIR